MAAHAYSVLDSYIYGFAADQDEPPVRPPTDAGEVAESMLGPFPANAYPNLVEFLTDHVMRPGYDYGEEFDSGST